MIKAKITGQIKFPPIDVDDDIEFVAKKIVIPLLRDGIDRNEDVNGSRFPPLEPGTAKAKGHSRPLVDTGLLRKSFKWKKVSKNNYLVYLNKLREKIAEYLQIDGVGRNKKKFKFMAVSKRMELDSIVYMQDKINAAIQRFNRGR